MPRKRIPDAEVLGRILLLQTTIHVQPDDQHMAEFLAAGLVRIPGIDGAAVCKNGCLLGSSHLEVHPPLRCREAFQAADPNPACPLPCSCADLGCVRLSLQSARRSYGGILLKITDETAFNLYRPFLENTANLIALLMENREREADMQDLQRSLEKQVRERTARFRQELAERQLAEEALRASECRLRTIIDAEPECVKVLAPDGRVLEMNPSGLAMIEADSLAEAQRRPLADYVLPEHRDGFVAYVNQTLAGRQVGSYAFEAVGLKGTRRWLETNAVPLRDAANNVIGLLGITRDITERRQAEVKLSESEARYHGLFSSMQEGFSLHEVICDDQGKPCDYRYLDVNPAFERITGIARSRWIGRRVREVLPQIESRWIEKFGEVALTGQPLRYEDFVSELDRHYAVIAYCPQPGQFAVVSWDITERKQAEDALRASLEEKVALLKEVHHRVKNNLQIVSSLLNLQARNIQSPEVQAFLRDTQSRIRAMALLHETLYGSGNLARVSFRTYVNSVCAHVARSYASDTRHVRLRAEIADVALPMDQAIPAGLIINELVSNSFKHAFADRSDGEITVQLQAADENYYALRVADNGVGLPAAADLQTSGTLGLRLVENLVRQLDGELTVNRGTGTRFQIVFPVPRL